MRVSTRLLFPHLGKAVLALSLAASASGCVIESDDCFDCVCPTCDPTDVPGTILTANIDADQQLETDFGNGAGVFIEYMSTGTWHVFTSCDVAISGVPCQFDVLATPLDAPLANVQAEGFESEDILQQDPGQLFFSVITHADSDGMVFDTTPGVAVRFEVYLDGVLDGRFVY